MAQIYDEEFKQKMVRLQEGRTIGSFVSKASISKCNEISTLCNSV